MVMVMVVLIAECSRRERTLKCSVDAITSASISIDFEHTLSTAVKIFLLPKRDSGQNHQKYSWQKNLHPGFQEYGAVTDTCDRE
jgi:hypothetical protein